jgi:hypothetical protein
MRKIVLPQPLFGIRRHANVKSPVCLRLNDINEMDHKTKNPS